MWSPSDKAAFQKTQQSAGEIIEAKRRELSRQTPATDPFVDATIDPELWQNVRANLGSGEVLQRQAR
jgi:hypothetical protein